MFDAVASTHSPKSDLTMGSIAETITHISAELPHNFPSSTLFFSVICHVLVKQIPFKTVFYNTTDGWTGVKGDRIEMKSRSGKSLKLNVNSLGSFPC